MKEIGKQAAKPLEMFGHEKVVLEATDDAESWGPGHADWVCLACGVRGPKADNLLAVDCAPGAGETG